MTKPARSITALALLSGLALVALTKPSFAANYANLGYTERLIDVFVNAANAWVAPLQQDATALFNGLVIIEIVWMVGWAVAGGIDIPGLLALLARQLVTIGFFYWLLEGGAQWPNAIIQSFSQAAQQANAAAGGLTAAHPEDILSGAMTLASQVWSMITIWNPAKSLLFVAAGFAVLIAMTLAAATLAEVIVEAALVAFAGVIMLGFGGTHFTRPFAVSYLRWAVGIGLRKMFVMLILGLGVGVMQQLAQAVPKGATDMDLQTVAIIVSVPVLFWKLAEKLPYKAQDIVAGSSQHHPLGVAEGMRSAVRSLASAATLLAGEGAAMGAAYSLAQAQISGRGGSAGSADTGGGPGGSGPGDSPAGGGSGGGAGGGQMGGSGGPSRGVLGQAFDNYSSANSRDVGMRLTGDGTVKMMNRGWRMANDMNNQAEELRNANEGDA